MTKREQLIDAYVKSLHLRAEDKKRSCQKSSNHFLAQQASDHMYCSECPLDGKCHEYSGESCSEAFEAWLKEEEK